LVGTTQPYGQDSGQVLPDPIADGSGLLDAYAAVNTAPPSAPTPVPGGILPGGILPGGHLPGRLGGLVPSALQPPACANLAVRPADVIVTDIFMPEMEDIETIHDLRREFPEAKIIAMSGRDPLANLDVFEVARQVGAAKTFNKPFKFEDLIAAVRELTGAKEQRAP